MASVTVLIFHRSGSAGEHDLVRVLSDVRGELVERQSEMFRRAGAREVRVVDEWHEGKSFGEVLAQLAPARGGIVVMGGGAVPLLNSRDAAQLVITAGNAGQIALTNNRYSSDVCAVAGAATLTRLPPLPSDNALPRWLEEQAGYHVRELAGRERLALDLDTPLDIALTALARSAPAWLGAAAASAGIRVPMRDELRQVAQDPHAELLVFGRSSSRTLAWLERSVRSRVRFLAEERGLRASSPLAIGGPGNDRGRRSPAATIGLLIDKSGASGLAEIVARLADAAVIDSRVLLAHRFGSDESGWPSAVDRFASDLHRPEDIADRWLRDLTLSARESQLPILLGGHSLIGPGIPVVLG